VAQEIVLKRDMLLRRNDVEAPDYNKRGTINALRGFSFHIDQKVQPTDQSVRVRIYNLDKAKVSDGRWKDGDFLLIPRRYFTTAYFEEPPFLGPLIMR